MMCLLSSLIKFLFPVFIAALMSMSAQTDSLSAEKIHEFHFIRGIYPSSFDMLDGSGYEFGSWWAIDYPKADEQLLVALRRLTHIDVPSDSRAIKLTDPELRRYPFLYMLEIGRSPPFSEHDVVSLRNYLGAGGFLVVDDFWGSAQWQHFENQLKRILPGRSIVELPKDHPVFNIFYNIPDIIQVPNVRLGRASVFGGPTYQWDGYVPHVRGVFDDDGRLMVLINWNTDLGDGWEWADDPHYPLRFSNYAFQMAINFIVYGMTY